jgi:hypothetical protein
LGRSRRLQQAKSIEALAFTGRRYTKQDPAVLDDEVFLAARELRRETPPPRRARVAGKLDMIRKSDSVFELLLDDGVVIRGLWSGKHMEQLKELFSQDVLMEGMAVYNAFGRLLRVEAEAVRPATQEDAFFRRTPEPIAVSCTSTLPVLALPARGGASAIWNRWPGEETEEELLAALEEMS